MPAEASLDMREVSAKLQADSLDTMEITFENINVGLGKRALLSNVAGHARPGKILALMGSSGAGKTTLLTTLAHRLEPGLTYSGTIRYGGLRFSKSLKKHIAFVNQQDDVVFESLTVRQHLTYSARLRLPSSTPLAEKVKRVDDVIHALKLESCADTRIGDTLARGVSGGERKRTNVAAELLTEPKVLMLDEYSTGLDSSIALTVTNILKDIARERMLTLIATVHQPSSRMFEAFDDLLLLAKLENGGGQVFYRGAARDITDYLVYCERPVPYGWNVPEWFMDVLVVEENVLNDPSTHLALCMSESFGNGSVTGGWKRRMQLHERDADADADADADGSSSSSSGPRNGDEDNVGTEAPDGDKGASSPSEPQRSPSPTPMLIRREVSVFGLEIGATLHEDLSSRYAVSWLEMVRILFMRFHTIHFRSVFSRTQIILNVGLTALASILWWWVLSFPRWLLCSPIGTRRLVEISL